MPRISRDQINKDENKILNELEKKSNESIDVLAKKCGFSRQKVWRIIKRLEENRFIWGYSVIVDEEKRNLRHFTVLIQRTMKNLEEKTIDIITSRKLEDLVFNLEITIENSFYTHGEYDWILTITAKDLQHAKKFCESLKALHQGVLEKITLIETLFFVKHHYILNPDAKRLKDFL